MSGLAAVLTPSQVDADDIRRVTDEVLSSPAYREAAPGALSRLLDGMLDVLARLLDQLGQGNRGAVIGTILFVLITGALVTITVVLLRRIRRDRGVASRPVGIGGRSATEWRDLARRAEAARDWPEALRCTYRALIAELVVAGLTDEVAGWTARDYLRDIAAAAPDTQPAMEQVTVAFETTWYGRRPVDADDVAAVREAAESVRRTALALR